MGRKPGQIDSQQAKARREDVRQFAREFWNENKSYLICATQRDEMRGRAILPYLLNETRLAEIYRMDRETFRALLVKVEQEIRSDRTLKHTDGPIVRITLRDLTKRAVTRPRTVSLQHRPFLSRLLIYSYFNAMLGPPELHVIEKRDDQVEINTHLKHYS